MVKNLLWYINYKNLPYAKNIIFFKDCKGFGIVKHTEALVNDAGMTQLMSMV